MLSLYLLRRFWKAPGSGGVSVIFLHIGCGRPRSWTFGPAAELGDLRRGHFLAACQSREGKAKAVPIWPVCRGRLGCRRSGRGANRGLWNCAKERQRGRPVLVKCFEKNVREPWRVKMARRRNASPPGCHHGLVVFSKLSTPRRWKSSESWPDLPETSLSSPQGLRTGDCSGSTDSVFKVGGSDPPHRARQSHSSGLWRRAGCQVRSAIRLIRGSVRSDRKAAGPRTSVSCRLMRWLGTGCGGSPRLPALTARNARVFQSLRMERDRQRALVYVAGSCDTTGTTRHVRAFPRTKTRPVRNNYCGAASRAETAKGLPRNGFSCEVCHENGLSPLARR
ncbi:MAG: hypothetical protein KatS3mg112_1031 [Thermogutta sp.]|nr:MAG: hypothetical protein KatS3mg112_1031 [Thermogutta sp.]